jgi:hypothetical protein
MSNFLTLRKALQEGLLEEFIAECEKEQLPSITEAEFDDAVRQLATPRQLEHRTERSQDPDGSTGTRTR